MTLLFPNPVNKHLKLIQRWRLKRVSVFPMV